MTRGINIKRSVQLKIMLIFLLLGATLVVGVLFVLRLSVLPTFEDFENQQSATSLSRVKQALQGQYKTLETWNLEYAWWDETYAWAQHPEWNHHFVEENVLYPDLWFQMGINLAVMTDPNGDVLWGGTVGPNDAEFKPLEASPFLQSAILPLFSGDFSGMQIQGLVSTPSDVLLITSTPILKNDGSGPPMGQMMNGRFLTEGLVAEISQAVSANVTFYKISDPDNPKVIQSVIDALLLSATPILHQQTKEISYARSLMTDVTGSPALLVEVSMPRTISAIGSEAISTALILLWLSIMLFIFLAWWLLRQLIVRPLFALKDHITVIRQSGDLTIPFVSGQNDEIGDLATEFNGLAGELNQTQIKLKETRDQAIALAGVKSEFLATMSHEIRTPMNGVLGMAELLMSTGLDKRQRIFVQNIQNSGDMLLHVINDILDFSRIESGKVVLESQEFDLRALIEDTLDLMVVQAHGKGLELMHSLPVEFEHHFIGDANRLRQILVNLVGNAIKFTNQGEIVVKVTVDGEDSSLKNVRIEIIDTGIGISREQQGRIFEEFSQADNSLAREYGGTGLGLSISSQLITLMGGKINLRSEAGKGSCFWFELPMQAGDKTSLLHQSQNALCGVRVLIVDDNDTNRKILQAQATGWGMNNEMAENGPQALKMMSTATADGTPYELILLDWHMPGMDGLEVARLIHTDDSIAPIRIMMLSSVAISKDTLMVLQKNVDQFLTKPVHQSDLYSCLVKLMKNGQKRVEQTQHEQIVINTQSKTFSADVLLVEDNAINQDVARFMLESTGCKVKVAMNGVVALEELDSNHFDLILMDCHMPEMDGFEATKLIRNEESISNTHTPIVALTANVLEGVRERCLSVGMDDFLTKPFSQVQLQAILNIWVPDKQIH